MNIEKWIEENRTYNAQAADGGVITQDSLIELLKTHAIVPREAIVLLRDAPELNLSNYDHDQVCELNRAVCQALSMIEDVEKAAIIYSVSCDGVAGPDGIVCNTTTEVQSQWQPIETAPKDGTEVLVMDLLGGIHGAKWHNGCGWYHHRNLGWLPSAKYWMPLPEYPKKIKNRVYFLL